MDGSLAENHELRSKLFEESSQTGTYPQLFAQDGTDFHYIGIWDGIQEANEAQAMLKEMPELKDNEEVMAKMLSTMLHKVWKGSF